MSKNLNTDPIMQMNIESVLKQQNDLCYECKKEICYGNPIYAIIGYSKPDRVYCANCGRDQPIEE